MRYCQYKSNEWVDFMNQNVIIMESGCFMCVAAAFPSPVTCMLVGSCPLVDIERTKTIKNIKTKISKLAKISMYTCQLTKKIMLFT